MAVKGLLTLFLLACCSCISVSLGGRSSPAVVYEVNPPPPARAASASCLVLRIADFTASPAYDRTDMVVVDSTGRVVRASGHRWASTPASLLADLLTRDLMAEGRFESVYRRYTLVGEDVQLDAHVREFGSRYSGGSWVARVETDVTILDTRSGTIAFQGTIRLEEPMPSGGFDELATTMGKLAGRWSSEVRAELDGICVSD
ncbi:membrane integrity-associated transporter subunit PqiC [Candidatus Fermentibacteria bacterium]|nr:membrane integrity-associated transporter subunit PqiC [Candidatus Fermentibacteria bacterium]